MTVLIVSKTRMHGDHVCVGGFDLEAGRNVRLLTAQGYNQPTTTTYQIGEIWSVVYRPRAGCEPPHVEDVLVDSSRRVDVQADLAAFVRVNCPVVVGALNNAFGGHLQYAGAGSAFISRGAGIPDGSVCFWEANERLRRDDFDTKVRYTFRQGFANRHISFVGFQKPWTRFPKAHWCVCRWLDGGNPRTRRRKILRSVFSSCRATTNEQEAQQDETQQPPLAALSATLPVV